MPRNYWTPARTAQFEAMDAKNKAKHKHNEVTAEEQKERNAYVEEPAALQSHPRHMHQHHHQLP